MLSTHVNSVVDLTLPQANEICMKFARILVAEKFNMENLASVEVRIMELLEERLTQLGKTPEENPLWTMGLMCEIALYVGINIGVNYSQEEKEKNDPRTN